ncbi:hypothetical protein [Agarilytica rhodophyticola]|uniref:hypothetical protein n=1 Tax=Agarilytica rhodophyticola TaxID=1737490 RepID=UPI000B347EE9|nr:hypothetical protein [Agarilytica rhodophyticola]
MPISSNVIALVGGRQSFRTLVKLATPVTGVLLYTLSQAAWSGAWVPQKGDGYAKIGYADYSADDFFGNNDDLGEFNGVNISYYGEQGLGNNIGIFGSLLYQDLEQIDSSGNLTESSGFGDTELGIRYQWQASPFVFSTSFTVKLPFLYDEDDELPRGNGQEDYELRFLIGRSLNQYGYFGIEAGYRLRVDEPSDEYRYLIEYGFNVNDNLYLRTKIDAIESAGNADTASTGTNTNLSITPEFDLGRLELTAGWNFGEANTSNGRWGIEFTYNKDLYGDNALKGDGFQIGLTRAY